MHPENSSDSSEGQVRAFNTELVPSDDLKAQCEAFDIDVVDVQVEYQHIQKYLLRHGGSALLTQIAAELCVSPHELVRPIDILEDVGLLISIDTKDGIHIELPDQRPNIPDVSKSESISKKDEVNF